MKIKPTIDRSERLAKALGCAGYSIDVTVDGEICVRDQYRQLHTGLDTAIREYLLTGIGDPATILMMLRS